MQNGGRGTPGTARPQSDLLLGASLHRTIAQGRPAGSVGAARDA